MNKLPVSLAIAISMTLFSLPVFSQMTTRDTGKMNSTTDSTKPELGAPMSGANSFTEAQAKDRIMKEGYSAVNTLTKTPEGIWTGSATKQGKQVTVMMDYRGNITDQ